MKKYKLIITIVISFLLGFSLSYTIHNLIIPNENKVVLNYDLSRDIALQIGKIILIDKFPEVLNEETQFVVFYKSTSWIISSSGISSSGGSGVYRIEIQKSNCEILKIEVWD